MHHELKIPPDQTVYYRYNPQADVLAVRFTAQFEPGEETPLPDLPQVSLTRDSESGACVGLRIAGVQQLILGALVRDVLAQARPELESAGALAPAEIRVERHVAQAPAPASAAQAGGPSAAVAVAPAAPPTPLASPTVTRVAAEPPAAPVAAESFAAPMARSASTPAGPEARVEASARPDPTAGDEEADDKPRRKRRRRRRRGKSSGAAERAAEASVEAPVAAPSPARAEQPAPGMPAGNDADRADVARAVAAVAAAMGAARGSGARGSDAVAVPADRATGAAPAEPASAPSQVGPAATPVETRRAASEPTGQDDARSVAEPVASAEAPPEAPSTPTEAPAAASERPAAPPAVAPAPLPLAESFAALGLHPSVGDAIAAMGFDTPTPIQVEAIPVAMTGRDVIGLAQTGTGKTLAFVAPALHRILTTRREGEHLPGLLVLAPTRELTVQVAEEAERLSARSGLRVATIYGGVGMGPQIDALKGGVDVIVATPGRMLDHLRRGNVKIGSVQTLVLDEADRMLDMGFLPDVRTILRFLGEDRQTLFFTATMPPEIESLSLEFQREPVVVEIARRKPPESIDQLLYPVGKHLKAPLLVHLLKSDPDMKSVLVFTERKIDADVLAKRLREEGLKVALMHGDRRQQDREQALEDLASGKVQVLVATNVAARGLDIDDISHVVNYDIPQTVDEYVHRIGRTARAEAEGSAWTLVTVSDEVMVARIESALGRKLPRVQDPTFDYDVPTPSWAKPSAKDVLAMLNKSQSVADRMRHLGRRR